MKHAWKQIHGLLFQINQQHGLRRSIKGFFIEIRGPWSAKYKMGMEKEISPNIAKKKNRLSATSAAFLDIVTDL